MRIQFNLTSDVLLAFAKLQQTVSISDWEQLNFFSIKQIRLKQTSHSAQSFFYYLEGCDWLWNALCGKSLLI